MIAQKCKACRIPLLYSLCLLRKAICRESWRRLYTLFLGTPRVWGQTSLHLGQFQSWICSEQHWATEEHLLPNKERIAYQTLWKQFSLLGCDRSSGICSTQLAFLRPRGRLGQHAEAALTLSPLSLTQAYSVLCWRPWRGTGSSPFTCPDPTHLSKNLSVIGITPPPVPSLSPEGSWK